MSRSTNSKKSIDKLPNIFHVIQHKSAYLLWLIALVWLINGLFCKVLNLVPRHQLIVARILGEEYAGVLTKTVGILEIIMAVWIVTSIRPKLCTITQIALVISMNVIEFILAPDLLLFGRANSIVAACFVVLLYFNEFVFHRGKSKSTFGH